MKGIATQLADARNNVFRAALADARNALQRGEDTDVVSFTQLASGLIHADKLLLHTKADRLGKLARLFLTTKGGGREVALASRELPSNLRAAVASQLSPRDRRVLYGREEPFAGAGQTPESKGEGAAQVNEPQLNEKTDVLNWAVSLISVREQEANKSLLKGNKFAVNVWESIDEAVTSMSDMPELCGVCVDGSVLESLSVDEQLLALERISGVSTISALRIDRSGLLLEDNKVKEIVSRAHNRRETVDALRLSIEGNGRIQEGEISNFIEARRLLSTFDNSRFAPEQLSQNEARVLASAVQKYTDEIRNYSLGIQVIRTEFLPGGKTESRIALVSTDAGGNRIVAKLDKKTHIEEEIRRFRTIQWWDDSLRPTYVCHGDVSLILFGLVTGRATGYRPAPMLEDELRRLWAEEAFGFGKGDIPQQESRLTSAFAELSAKLGELNSKPRPDGIDGRADIQGKWIGGLDEKGVPKVLIRSREASLRQYKGLCGKATVHGDIQLRNILVGQGGKMHLIDYAFSGPGHPAIDLVRLEVALYTKGMRIRMPEDTCKCLQRDISINGASFNELKGKYPMVADTALNRACLGGILAARDEALKVLGKYSGDIRDYVAVKVLVAWQTLLVFDCQINAVQSILASLEEAVPGS